MICNNSILTIREKISLRLFKTFRHISLFYSCSFRHALMCASVLIFSCRYFIVFCSLPLHLFQFFHPSVSFRAVSSMERHTPRLRRVLSAPCGASNSGTDFFLAGFHPSTPSLPDALKVIAAVYSFPRYGRGIVAAA